MKTPRVTSLGLLELAVLALTFVLTLTARVWGISARFWLLQDQIRDWSIALNSFTDLPLVGPPTHVGGYTIGPAFYWILWAIRVSLGPWFQNLPHAGGIGQAALQSAADTLLLAGLWRRTQSPWIALTAIVLVATAAYDLCLSALVWNPTMGSALAKMATALVLLDWHRGSTRRRALTAVLAWSAVHAYTGAIFVATGVFAAMLVDPLLRGDRPAMWRSARIIAAVVALLQVPYIAHQLSHRFGDQAMGAVSESVVRVMSGTDPPQLTKSVLGLVGAFQFIQLAPWHVFIQLAPWNVPLTGWALLGCCGIVAVRYRRDPSLLAVTLLPQILAIIGYALFLAPLDHYYYLSVVPAMVITVLLATAAWPSRRLTRAVGIAFLAGALALTPARLRFAATLHRMPEYGLLVDASRRIRNLDQPMREIRTAFALPPTSDPEFLYKVLGGRIDRRSPWTSVITADGRIEYRHDGGL